MELKNKLKIIFKKGGKIAIMHIKKFFTIYVYYNLSFLFFLTIFIKLKNGATNESHMICVGYVLKYDKNFYAQNYMLVIKETLNYLKIFAK